MSQQQTRGNIANLPAEGLAGQLFVTLDTSELYVGQGLGESLKKFSPKRYSLGAGSFVFATGYGVTLEQADNTCNFIVPAGVEIISASIRFDLGDYTSCLIDLSAGCGANNDYINLFAPQFQVWADVENSRFFKTGVLGNFNTASNVLELTGLTAFQAIWINLSF